MEKTATPENQPAPLTKQAPITKSTPPEKKSRYLNLKLKKPKPLLIIAVLLVIAAIVALFLNKDLLVAATVNGSPISRVSIIKELEKQGGKQTLETIINQKLIDTELLKQGITVTPEEVDEEIKKIEAQVVSQGGTLAEALATEGLTEEKLREQIGDQKKLEKILADKIAVSDEEIDTYLKENKATPPEGVTEEDFKNQLREQLKQQKFQQEAQKWVADLTASAKIKYYVEY